jgi:hypothetical protein
MLVVRRTKILYFYLFFHFVLYSLGYTILINKNPLVFVKKNDSTFVFNFFFKCKMKEE